MTVRVAVECFADLTLLEFLRETCGLKRLSSCHSEAQGEVIKDVFERKRAETGIVDEDPGKPHHALRDRTSLVQAGLDVEIRALDSKYLFILKPNLEACFIRAMSRVKETSWFETASRMHRILGVSSARASKDRIRFKAELERLRGAGIRRNIGNLVSELEQGLRDLGGG